MKWLYSSIGLFLLVGVVIAFFSMYKASVDGVMKKAGLIRSDFSVSVVKEKLDILSGETRNKVACNLPARLQGSISYLISRDWQQGEIAFDLGEQRIYCGAGMLSTGDVETGTYEILKGFGYLSQGYRFVNEKGQLDKMVCKGLPGDEVEKAVMTILEGTRGKVNEIIWSEWKKVLEVREPAEAMCLDRRQ